MWPSAAVALKPKIRGRHLLEVAGDEVQRRAAGVLIIHVAQADGEGLARLVEHGGEAQDDDHQQRHGDHDLDEREPAPGRALTFFKCASGVHGYWVAKVSDCMKKSRLPFGYA